ncbi:protein argonaute-2-like isoform X1 [Cimex lectularius]|uniref:Argonaute n=1 Tax=Cimex lectularius TaxID=79782 RepID=A0A8I6S9V5_CIMLE|nr:protein argonaute-2-like isoform X1 [Cimex lectularius]XP_014259237.1 protein argonaute-2-like isoform X1 [Cimex lectularius]
MGKKGKKKTSSSGSSSGTSSSGGGVQSPSESSCSTTSSSKPSTTGSSLRQLTRKSETNLVQTSKFAQRGGGDADILCHPGFQPEKDFPTLPTRGVDSVVSFQPVYPQVSNWNPQRGDMAQVRNQLQHHVKHRLAGPPWPLANQSIFMQQQQQQQFSSPITVLASPTLTKFKGKPWGSQAQYLTELPPEEKRGGAIPKIQPQILKQPLHDSLDYPITKLTTNKIAQTDSPRHIQDLRMASFIPKRVEGRPDKENRGRQILVDTNHLNLDIKNKNAIIHHYDVVVEPEKPHKFYREALEMVRCERYPKNYPSFDGKKNIYSVRKLPFEDDVLIHNVHVHDNERGKDRELTVKIKWVNTVNLSSIFEYMKGGESTNIPQDAIQAIDVALRQPSARNFCQVGRSYFTPPDQVIPLGDGLDLWYGFFQSAIIGWKPYLNIDVAHKGFPSPVKCVEAVRKFMQVNKIEPTTSLDQYCHSNFRSFIKGLKVVYIPPRVNGLVQRRTYKVIDLGLPAKDNIFEIPDKGKTSVWKYYCDEYGYNIEFINLPTLQCGSKARPISLPIELCEIQEGQVIMKKMNETQTRNMVRAAAVPAYERKKKIEASIRTVSFNTDPYIQEFGLSVSSEFTKVPARVLDPPTLEYKEQQSVRVSSGVWRSGKFLKPCNLEHWYIYSVDTKVPDKKLKDLAYKLMEVSKEVGMVIKEPKERKIMSHHRELEHDLTNFSTAQVVFVVLPDRGPVTYAKVKQMAELKVGVLTQCIKSRTLTKCNSNSTVTNILLKLNAKLNGINHSITSGHWPSFFKKPVMVVGADVTHPAPDQVNVPSVAAVAASHDPKAFLYNMIYRIQPPREEIIKDLENIMREQLMVFYKRTNHKPHAILFYRDGVSEGQFKKVIDEEVLAIRRACKKLSKEYEPLITFLVVQKRHHTRFFPGPNDAEGKNKNVPAGTVVDTEIVHPTELDFYLVSHASIQGTSRPTKYHLLCDDSNMSEDDLEEITFYLCHLFTRCTRSVSYPAPTYYAHLAAFRVRSYIDNAGINLSNLKYEEKKREIKPDFAQSSPMFFV